MWMNSMLDFNTSVTSAMIQLSGSYLCNCDLAMTQRSQSTFRYKMTLTLINFTGTDNRKYDLHFWIRQQSWFTILDQTGILIHFLGSDPAIIIHLPESNPANVIYFPGSDRNLDPHSWIRSSNHDPSSRIGYTKCDLLSWIRQGSWSIFLDQVRQSWSICLDQTQHR